MDLNPTALLCELSHDLNDLLANNRNAVDRPEEYAAALALRSSLLKKFSDLQQHELRRADEAAIKKFVLMNERSTGWSGEHPASLWIPELVGHLKKELHSFFYPSNKGCVLDTLDEVYHLAKCGPGVALGSLGTDFYTKLYSSPLAASRPSLVELYRVMVSRYPLEADAEKHRVQAGYGESIVDSSKITTVPKNVDISRVIAIEPSLNVFFQLGVGELLSRRLKSRFSIDISSQQETNRALAKAGSLSGQFVTIDLESASDSISLKMLEKVLDRQTLAFLKLFRTPNAKLPDGRQVELGMLSTMGNGYTFPFQTVLFSCIVSAARSFLGLRQERAGKSWSVFGDDIICCQRVAGAVVDLLTYLGFIVNPQKSFFEGPFRESCGKDYYNGSDIRGVYIKSLRRPQDRCATINQLNLWTARTGIPIPRLVGLLAKSVRFTPVPLWDNDEAGIKVPFSFIQSQLTFHKDYQSIMYYRYEAKPNQLIFGEGTVRAPRGSKQRIFNPSGIIAAMLNGTLVDGRITIRHNCVTFRRRWAIAPNWERSPTGSDIASESERQRLISAVEANLKR